MSTPPSLYVFSGLPGVGKTTLARRLAQHAGAVFLRIDTIEQALRDLCAMDVQAEGYGLAYRLAMDNLRLGLVVVADSCNPLELTRNQWDAVAGQSGARVIHIEVVCSDAAEHRRRVERRRPGVPGLILPTWQQVCEREYHPWSRPRIRIDTAGQSEDQAFALLLAQL